MNGWKALGLCAAMALAGCGAGERTEAASGEAASGGAAVRAGCPDCDAMVNTCIYSGCLAQAHGDPATYWYLWNPCVDACVNTQYVPCVQARDAIAPTWEAAGPTMQLCHVDPDLHLDGVTVEIYTADRYVDASCRGSADSYAKRLVQSVHCGFASKSSCAARVTAAVTALAQQGYVPTFTEADQDQCPTPRKL